MTFLWDETQYFCLILHYDKEHIRLYCELHLRMHTGLYIWM